MRTRTAFLFPGLGAYSTGVLRRAHQDFPVVGETFAEIDATAAEHDVPPISGVLFGSAQPTVAELLDQRSELLQLAIFGASVATHRVLVAEGAEPDLLVGHSFGEMAALVCADAFDLAEGVRLVCARTAALRSWEGWGAMAAVGASETVVRHLIGLVEEPDLVVGCANAPRQNVISGPAPAVERAVRAAGALDLFAARLNLPYASHHPAMRAAADEFMALMAPVRQRSLRRAVHTPIHGRRYTDEDDLRQALADCLVLPVRFVDMVRALHEQGYTRFVEVGALNALTRCVARTVPDVETFAPLLVPESETEQLRAVAGLRADPPVVPEVADPASESAVVAPIAEPAPPPAPRPHPPIPAARGEAAPAGAPVNGAARGEVLDRLRELYAAALEYPPDVLTEGAALEAELGVDSLKQTSLLTRVVAEFVLDEDPGQLRVWELGSLGAIADHVLATRSGVRG